MLYWMMITFPVSQLKLVKKKFNLIQFVTWQIKINTILSFKKKLFIYIYKFLKKKSPCYD